MRKLLCLALLWASPAFAEQLKVEELHAAAPVQVSRDVQTPATALGQFYASPGVSIVMLFVAAAFFVGGSRTDGYMPEEETGN